MFRRCFKISLTCAALVALLPSRAAGQASLQVPLEFDFLNPGARALALGSAFVGLADDATAAFTNPAGLTILLRSEVSFEGRGRQTESRFLERGRLSGTLTNQGIDTVNGPHYETSTYDEFVPGFISFVYPRANKVAIAVYRHELTNLKEEFKAQGVFQFDRGFNSDIRELALEAARELHVTNYGVSGAFRPTEAISIGGGISFFDMSLQSTFTRFVTVPFNSEATFDPQRAVFVAHQTSDDMGIGGSIGVLWMPRRQFQVGAVFRKGPGFDFQQTLQDLPGGTPTVQNGTFQIPDAFALGAAVRPNDAVTITAEYTFVQYTALKDDYIDVQARPSNRQDQFQIDDGHEFHVGLEYVFAGVRLTPAVRAGYWYDPAHAVFYVPTAAHDTTDERFAAYAPGTDALSHVTFGAGLPVNEHFEVNGGVDLSSRRKFYSILAVVRF